MISQANPATAYPAAPACLGALSGPEDVFRLDYAGLTAEFQRRFGKGEYHAGALFRALYRAGRADPGDLPEFSANPSLARAVRETFRSRLPAIAGFSPAEAGAAEFRAAGGAYKFLLALGDGLQSESVVIPMKHYRSLCVSSQVGCKMGCNFCETAQMGFLRSLSAGEIVAQAMVARHVLGEPVENVVFMGMGEPMDNLDEVLRAARILADQRGLGIPQSGITISTVGHVDGIRRLARVAAAPPPEGLPRLRLAVSLNAPNDEIRSRIMPVNRQWPLAELKAALAEYPLPRRDDFLFMEYVLIPGVNDAREHALETAEYLRGLKACVNLIPYNPRRDSPYARPERDGVARFFHWLMEAGQYCRVRGTKGQEAMAACGQLGNPALRRGVRSARTAAPGTGANC